MVEDNVSSETSVFYSHDFLFYKLFIEKNWEAKIWRASLNEHLDKLSMTKCLVKTKYWLWQGRGGNKPLSDKKKKLFTSLTGGRKRRDKGQGNPEATETEILEALFLALWWFWLLLRMRYEALKGVNRGVMWSDLYNISQTTETSLVFQRLRLGASTEGGVSLVPDEGTKSLHAV